MNAKPDTWMPLVIGDYLKDTARLTTEQHGAYLLLIMDYWVNGPPPDADDELAAITGLDLRGWRKHREKLSKFFRIEGGVWRHKRVDEELERWAIKKERYVARAVAAADKRWAAEGRVAGEPRSKRLSDARSRGTHTPEEWERMKAFFGARCVRCGHGGELVKDHIVPVYKKGADDIENIQPLCRSCNAGKSGENIDYRGTGWREHVITHASMHARRVLDACSTRAPQPASREVDGPTDQSTLSGQIEFLGPKEVRDAFVSAKSEDWARSYIDPCGWQDVPERALVPATQSAARAIIRDARPVLKALGLSVLEKAA